MVYGIKKSCHLAGLLQETFCLKDIRSVVNIKHLAEGIGPQTAAVGNERTLEITHTAFPSFHTAVEGIKGRFCQSVDSA